MVIPKFDTFIWMEFYPNYDSDNLSCYPHGVSSTTLTSNLHVEFKDSEINIYGLLINRSFKRDEVKSFRAEVVN